MNRWILAGSFSLALTAGLFVQTQLSPVNAQDDELGDDQVAIDPLREDIRTVKLPVIVNERLLRDIQPGRAVHLMARTWGHPGMVWSPVFRNLKVTAVMRNSRQQEDVREVWFRVDPAMARRLAPYARQPSLTCAPNDVKDIHAYLTSIGVAEFVSSDPHHVRDLAMDRIHELRDRLSADDADRGKLLEELRDASSQYFDADLQVRRQDLAEIRSRLETLEGQLRQRTESKNRILDLQIKVWENESNGLGFFDRDVLHLDEDHDERLHADELGELLRDDDPEHGDEFRGRSSEFFGDESELDDPLEVEPELFPRRGVEFRVDPEEPVDADDLFDSGEADPDGAGGIEDSDEDFGEEDVADEGDADEGLFDDGEVEDADGEFDGEDNFGDEADATDELFDAGEIEESDEDFDGGDELEGDEDASEDLFGDE